MNCEEVLRHLHDYVSGELSANHRESLMEHLDGCAACRRFLRQIKKIRTALENTMNHDAPPELHRVVREMLADA